MGGTIVGKKIDLKKIDLTNFNCLKILTITSTKDNFTFIPNGLKAHKFKLLNVQYPSLNKVDEEYLKLLGNTQNPK